MAAVAASRAVPRATRTAKKDPASTGTDPLGHLRSVADALNKEVAAALEKAEVEVVHKLRTGTRRVEATLETILRERGDRTFADQTLPGAAEAWLGELKKLRRAAGEVRDLDVHREIVDDEFLKASKNAKRGAQKGALKDAPADDTTAQPSPATSAQPAQPSDASAPPQQSEMVLREQAESLDDWLAGRRHKRADKLVRKLSKLQGDLRSNEDAFLAAAQQDGGRQRRGAPRNPGLLSLEDFLRLVDQMPVLEAANLHDFRKGAKKARYVAEAGDDDPWSKAIGKAIKQVQDAIGDWHDWLVLGEEAEQALGAAGAALRERIATGTTLRFTRAMTITERMRRRLLGEWLALNEVKRRAPRATQPEASARYA